jgi:ribonucleoside-diphosphate reductase alpha chain
MSALIPVTKVRKRNGQVVRFEPRRIKNALHKALVSSNNPDGELAQELSSQVVDLLGERFVGRIPGVEDVQDVVEEVLINNGLTKTARAYILYREEHAKIREAKSLIGVEDALKLSVNAVKVLEARYLAKDESGKVVETPSEMFQRVAQAVAQAELAFGQHKDVDQLADEFYQVMSRLEFLPNSPTLMNAGNELGQLAACFVLPVEDSLKSIFEAVSHMAIINQSGGGTGFSFSRLRPKGDFVKSTKGVASGPVSFINIFDVTTNTIRQGGRRRGANMGILRVDHPDILEFIHAKQDDNALLNFNLSVGVTDTFMQAVANDNTYDLINPRNGRIERSLKARDVFDQIAYMAWRTGDPGLLFLDEINRQNPLLHLGEIESTNPCGEQPLLPYESCTLGSINLSRMVENNELNWDKLKYTVHLAVRFLDNVIEVNKYPLDKIEALSKQNRKIGLGVMGFADTLIKLGVRYDSEKGLACAEEIMAFITKEARAASAQLARERGSYPNWSEDGSQPGLRNATLTTIAPTGTISIIAGCSSGIEPLFALTFVRSVMDEVSLIEVNPLLVEALKKRGLHTPQLMNRIRFTGSIQSLTDLPEELRRLFVTAFDVSPEWHIRMQAAFQKYTDNSVSKTINLPADAGIEDIKKAYLMAYELKCKGITAYRYGSKLKQVLYVGDKTEGAERHINEHSPISAGRCPNGECVY